MSARQDLIVATGGHDELVQSLVKSGPDARSVVCGVAVAMLDAARTGDQMHAPGWSVGWLEV